MSAVAPIPTTVPTKVHDGTGTAWRRARYALYAAIVWIAMIGATEVGLRLFGMGPPRARDLPDRYSKFAPDDELIWVLKPDWDGFERNDVRVHHNSLGLRGPDPAADAGDQQRIVFLGDSVTFGHFLPFSVTLPHLLQQNLSSSNELKVEVINAGVPGYSTFQEAGLLRRHGKTLKPDLILLGFCMNDITERYRALAAYGGADFFMVDVDTTVGMSVLRRGWRRSAIRSALVKMLRTSAKSGEASRLQNLFTASTTQQVQDDWQVAYKELDQLADEARLIGAPLAVVIYPIRPQMQVKSGLNAPQAALIRYLAPRGIPFIDLLEPLRNAQSDDIFLDVTHLSELGSRVAAAEIAKFIRTGGLLPDRLPLKQSPPRSGGQ